MTPSRRLPVLVSLLLAAAALLWPVREAQACVWNYFHGFQPYPSCESLTKGLTKRIGQQNAQLAAKLITLSMEIQVSKAEVRAWQRNIEEARRFEERLRTVHGEVRVNALRSLVAAYERAPVLAHVREAGRVREVVAAGGLADSLWTRFLPEDIRARADSVWNIYQSRDSVSRLYLAQRLEDDHRLATNPIHGYAEMARRQLADIEAYGQATLAARESLLVAGAAKAARYEGESDAGGLAEAQITALAAGLDRLRGTALATQAQALDARISSLQHLYSTRTRLEGTVRRNVTGLSW